MSEGSHRLEELCFIIIHFELVDLMSEMHKLGMEIAEFLDKGSWLSNVRYSLVLYSIDSMGIIQYRL